MLNKNDKLTRRDFLVYSGAASSSLVLGFKKSKADEIERFSKSFILQPLELQKILSCFQESF